MSCESNISKEERLLFWKIKAERLKNNILKPTTNNLLKLLNRSRILPSPRRSQVDELVQAFIQAILNYNEAFNANCSQALDLVDEVANKEPSAIDLFKKIVDELSINIQGIQAEGDESRDKLDALRQKISGDIRDLATQYQDLELNRVELEDQIYSLQNEIKAIQQQLQSTYDNYWICRATSILIFVCDPILEMINAIIAQQLEKNTNLEGKVTELAKLNNQLAKLEQQKKNLDADYSASGQILTEIISTNQLTNTLLNNVEGIGKLLTNLNVDNIAMLLNIKLDALQTDWKDLVDFVELFSSVLQLN